MGYHVYLRHGTSLFCNFKYMLESRSGPVTADLTTTVALHVANNKKQLTHEIF